MIDDFIERKWGRRAVEYMFLELEPILRETLGVIVYQEQVMQISSAIGGYSLGGADLLRRAMGKKDPEEMAKQRDTFMAGAVKHKFDKNKAGALFDLMEQFAGYGFNKSHSAAYALLAYHTAWLKTHYPVEFMAALLTSETSKPENVVKYIQECREMGIPVVPPDVQRSDANFTPVRIADGTEAIGFGLAAIKNVGHNAIVSILAARDALRAEGKPGFSASGSSARRWTFGPLNKRVLGVLIKAGAMDSFYGPRGQDLRRAGQGYGAGAEKPERCCGRPSMDSSAASSTRILSLLQMEQEGRPATLPRPEWDEHIHACRMKKSSWASSSQAIPWISIEKSYAISRSLTPRPPAR